MKAKDDIKKNFEKIKQNIEDELSKMKGEEKKENPTRNLNDMDDLKGKFEKIKEKVEEGC